LPELGLEKHVVDRSVYENSVKRFREKKIPLPTFAELAEPERIPAKVKEAVAGVDRDGPHALNLFRVHWYNTGSSEWASVPEHFVLPESLTGVKAKIMIARGDRFPMIRTHKVLAAYGCLAPRIITGQFDPTVHKAIWPSTGNYCRGGVAIARIMDCHGVAILPEGMSRERFRWLEEWVADPADIIPTPGTESNVKEIYDKCAELDTDPQNIIFNQFSEFGNHLAHYLCTGKALERVFEWMGGEKTGLRLRAFVSATGSAGTLGAGDYLKDLYGSRIVVAEALECPTLLYNGFGEHNIQGIGDKHVPLIHNVMNTDLVAAISDENTDGLNVVFNTPAGREYLAKRRDVPAGLVEQLGFMGVSSICNVLSAIKTAKYYDMGPDDVIATVATDGAALYETERDKTLAGVFGGEFDQVAAGETFGRHMLGTGVDHLMDLTHRDRQRIFNLGYFTWVEQQGISIPDFTARRDQAFWRSLRDLIPAWDGMIDEFNGRTGVLKSL
jgi:cysteine synthase A